MGGPNDLINDIIKHIENSAILSVDGTRISNFQKKCTVSTLEKLANKKNADALVFLAGTGFGKSFAYQLPLLLWILIKKITAHEKFLRDGTKLSVPCSALLIFPRVSLAHDQNKKLVELTEIINNFIERYPRITSSRQKEFLQIEPPMRDFSDGDSNPTSHYDEEHDIIITTPQSLGNRLANPECHPVYKNGIDLMWGCMDESIVSISAAIHIALSSPSTKYLDLDGSFDLAKDIVSGGFKLISGKLMPTMKPGLGVDLNNKALA